MLDDTDLSEANRNILAGGGLLESGIVSYSAADLLSL